MCPGPEREAFGRAILEASRDDLGQQASGRQVALPSARAESDSSGRAQVTVGGDSLFANVPNRSLALYRTEEFFNIASDDVTPPNRLLTGWGEVRRLAAGAYRSRERAACWDGSNDAGERVASGAYFIQL